MVGVNLEAIEEAEHLTKFASTVHWITQTDPKADDEHAQALLATPNVKHWSKTRMLEIEGDTSGVTQVRWSGSACGRSAEGPGWVRPTVRGLRCSWEKRQASPRRYTS